MTLVSFFLWFNVFTTPAIMVFPILNEKIGNWLWLNELIWFLEIVRKLIFQNVQDDDEGEDVYNLAVAYIKSTLILDVIAIAPQIFYFMDPNFAAYKSFRVYQVSLLHQPATIIIRRVIKREHI